MVEVAELPGQAHAHDRAAEPPVDDTGKPSQDAAAGLEYQTQPLLDDVFVPSKEISDDYPIPFPVDI